MKDWIAKHRQEMTEDIRGLVEINSVAAVGETENAPCGQACALVAEGYRKLAGKYGFEAESCGGYCVRIPFQAGKSRCESKRKRVEVWNHLDVVPEGEGWIYPPFGCTKKGDFLIGRGVSDNKGAAVAVLYALRYLAEQQTVLCYDLSQVCGLCEETGMKDAEWYVKHYGSPDIALIADCRFPLCCGEKGRLTAEAASVCRLPHIRQLSAGLVSNSVADSAVLVLETAEGSWRMEARGVSGHAAAPERCVNPIGLLAKEVEKRKDLELTGDERRLFTFLKKACGDGYGEGLGIASEDAVFGRMTCAGTVLRFREGKAVLEFDLRFPPKTDINNIIKEMKEAARRYGMQLKSSAYTEGFWQNPGQTFAGELLAASREVYADAGEPYVMGGNTYARFFERAVGFGPGIPGNCEAARKQAGRLKALELPEGHGGGHGADEAQSVEGLCNAVQIYVSALQRLNRIYRENTEKEEIAGGK